MKTWLSNWWERLRGSYWFVPSLLAIGAIGLSALTLHIDTTINPRWARNTAWIWAGGAEGVAAAPNERDKRDIEGMFVGAEQALAL